MKLLPGLIAAVIFVTTSAHAASELGRGFVGPLGGLAFPSTSSTAFSLGFHGSYRITPSIGLGPFYARYGVSAGVDNEKGTANVDTSTTYYGVEPTIFFSGSLARFFFGVRLGLASFQNAASADDRSRLFQIDESSIYLFLGPNVGYDYPVGRFSFGGELTYMRGIGTYSPSALLFLSSAKFWF